MTFRYDLDPQFYDDQGFMWSEWMLKHFLLLNAVQDRTEAQNNEIDMIFETARKGRVALNELENKLKEKNSL